MTTDMGAATRPQIAFSYNGYSLNDLPGYRNEMDLTGVRDSITPVSNGQLQVTIKAYENVIDSLDYTVYSIDGKEKLLEQKVKKPGENATLEVGNVDGENILSEERMLQITLHMDNHDMYYYTRIVDGAKLNAAQAWIMYKVSMKMHWRKRKVLELERRLSPVMKETTRHYSM